MTGLLSCASLSCAYFSYLLLPYSVVGIFKQTSILKLIFISQVLLTNGFIDNGLYPHVYNTEQNSYSISHLLGIVTTL